MEVTKDTVLTFELTVEETNNVLAGLQELSAKICNPLTANIQKQAQKQLAPKEQEASIERPVKK